MRRTTLALTTTLVALGGTVAVSAPASAATPPIRIVKIQYDSPGSDSGGNTSLNAEYVVLKNTTRSARSLTGWTLRDKQGFTYKFPKFTLKAGATVTIHTGKGKATGSHRYYNRTWYVWNNTGDTAYVRDSKGKLVDSWAFKDKSGPAYYVTRK